MIKKYWKWQFSRWWPLLLIFSVLLTAIFFFTCSTASITYRTVDSGNGYGYTTGRPDPIVKLIVLLVASLITTVVTPFMVFSYRTKKQSADIFYQAAYKPGTIKRIRVLLGLFIIVASFTLAYIVGIAIYGIRYALTPDELVSGGTTYYKAAENFWVYIPAYFVLLICIVGEYFINCFLAGLGDYTLDQILLVLAGNLIIGLGVFSFANYALSLQALAQGRNSFNVSGAFITMPSFISTFYFLFNPLKPLFNGTAIPDTNELIGSLVSFGTYIGLGVATCLLTLLRGDPSGEFADRRGARNKTVALIPHGAALVVGFGISTGIGSVNILLGTQIVTPIFSMIMFGVAYYALLSLWRHTFKHSKFDFLLYGIVNGVVIIATVLFIIVASVSYQGTIH